MCGSAPKPPDPVKTAQAQAEYNTQAARDAAALNAVDQFGPYGSTTFQRNPDGTPASQTVELSPEVQQWLDSQFGASTGLSQAALQQIGNLPQDRFQLPGSPGARDIAAQNFGEGALDYSSFADPLADPLYESSRVDLGALPDTGNIAQTSYDQAKSLFEPDIEAARKQQSIQLARRGINPGDEIYNDEMDRLDRQANQAYAGASRQAVLDAGAEQSRQFGVNLGTAQYGAGEDARLAGTDLSQRQFLGGQQNQEFNRLAQALGYGRGEYQTDLANQLLERNQPYAEASALLGTSPTFQTPSFQGTAAQSVAPPDYAGQVQANYAQELAQSQNIWNTIGSLGAAVLPKLPIYSDERMKEDRVPADGEAILMSFRDMPVDDYRYRDEAREMYGVPEQRTGTMAQDYAEHFGGDARTIDVGDAIGKLMASIKALDRRTAGMQEAY